ncbi:unnamed protein product, partial [Discosporangium mesarthrocarpum]
MACRRGFDARVCKLDGFRLENLPDTPLALFIVSTTGDGEVPSNMTKFWQFVLRRGLPADSLSRLTCAVFGLGDSGYSKFNAAGRKLHVRLRQLGAVELIPPGWGDDQSPRGMWGDLDSWLVALWAKLLALWPLPPGVEPDDTPKVMPPFYSITPLEGGEGGGGAEVEQGRLEFLKSVAPPTPGPRAAGRSSWGQQIPYLARLTTNVRLTSPDHFQDVRHLELEVPAASGLAEGLGQGQGHRHGGQGLKEEGLYGAGDVAWVYPENDANSVEGFAETMGIDVTQVVRIMPASEAGPRVGAVAGTRTGGGGEGCAVELRQPPPERQRQPRAFLPPVCCVGDLLRHHLDLLGTPRRGFFERLSAFAGDPGERDKLLELASPAGADLLHEYCTREKRTYAEALGDFPSCLPRLGLGRLLELVPPLRPRAFSIASSEMETPGRVQLCVAVVSFRTPYKRLRTGVCSSWLAGLGLGAEVPIWIRPGTFRLPPSPSHPLVMVGPGTGLAPMRSIILERRCLRAAAAAAAAATIKVRGWEGTAGGGGGTEGLSGGLAEEEGAGDTGAGTGAGGRVDEVPEADTLFFGCRHQDKDYLYGSELEAMSLAGGQGGGGCRGRDWGGCLSLHTAFSRDVREGEARVYVQRRIREKADLVGDLVVGRGAYVLVSGSAKQMPMDVRKAMVDVLAGREEV